MLAGLSTGSIYFLTVPSDHTVARECGKLLFQVDNGGQTRSFQAGFVSRQKDGNSSNDAQDKFKDDKFKDDPDVRGILSDIKFHFDQSDQGVNVPPKPNDESVANGSDSNAKEKEKSGEVKEDEESGGAINMKEESGGATEGSAGGGGTKNMKDLLEKIYGARTKAAAETSVGM